MRYLLLISFLFLSFCIKAQSILWQKAIGCSSIESPASYCIDADGNYLIVGQFYDSCTITGKDFGQTDAWIIKVDTNGEKIWSKGMGSTLTDGFSKVIATADGGYVALGIAGSDVDDTLINMGDKDCWMVKFDHDGNVLWQKLYGGSDLDQSSDIIETNNGDLIIAATTSSSDGDITNYVGGIGDAWIFRTNGQGDLLWSKAYGSTEADNATRIIKTTNGNYAVLGRAGNADNDIPLMHSPNNDIWLFTIDSNGTLLTSKTYGSTSINVSYKLIQTQDGGYMIGGATQGADMDATANYGDFDMWAIKLNDTGAIEWQKNYGGTSDDRIRDVIEINDGGYLFTGLSASNDIDAIGMHGLIDMFCVRTDSIGNILWKRTYGGSSGEAGVDIIRSFLNNSYLIGGVTNSNDGDVVGHNGNTDAWLVRILDTSAPSSIVNIFPQKNISVYPTITRDIVNIDLSENTVTLSTTLTDITGRKIAHTTTKKSNNKYAIALNDISSGIYLLQVTSNNTFSTFKIIHE